VRWLLSTVAIWLTQHDILKYCMVHDCPRWIWTHRRCCQRNRDQALRLLRSTGYDVD